MKPRDVRVRLAARRPPRRRSSTVACSMQRMADDGDRRLLAAADAGRARRRARRARASACSSRKQLARAPIRSQDEAVADADGERRRRGLAFLDDVEMGDRRRRPRRPRPAASRISSASAARWRACEAAEAVLDQVQVLDQQVAPARPVAEERAHLGEGLRIDLPPFGARASSAGLSRGDARGAERRWALRFDDERSCPPNSRSSRTA